MNKGKGGREDAQQKGCMDYSAKVVTSPDSALYSRELRNACPYPMSMEKLPPGNLEHNSTFLASSLASCSVFSLNDSLVFHRLLSLYTFPDE